MKKLLIIIFSLIGIITVGCSNSGDNNVSATDESQVEWTSEDLDSSFDESSSTLVTLNGEDIDVLGNGAVVTGTTLTIQEEGTYILEGNGENINVVVNAEKQLVRIVLNGVNINFKEDPGFFISEASKVIFILPEDTTNTLNGGDSLMSDDLDATIYSSADITFNGLGTLNIVDSIKESIHSKDTLKIVSGNINLSSSGDSIKGKDYVAIKDGNISITTDGDGIEATNEEDSSLGFIYIEGGTIKVDANQDGLSSFTSTIIKGGNITLIAGDSNISTDISQKGINANGNVEISGGEINIASYGDGINSIGDITISDSILEIASGDDGIHSDATLNILSGSINILESYEGIEGNNINIEGGDININSSDDGINVGGEASSSSNRSLVINNGNIVVNASGDGIDINGDIEMNGGSLTVYGPINNGNGALDYDSIFNLNGGSIMAGGSLGMVMTPSNSSKLSSVSIGFNSVVTAGSSVVIKDTSGNEIYSYISDKDIQSLVVGGDGLESGSTYVIYVNGSEYADFTVSNIINSVGTSGGGMIQQPGNKGF